MNHLLWGGVSGCIAPLNYFLMYYFVMVFVIYRYSKARWWKSYSDSKTTFSRSTGPSKGLVSLTFSVFRQKTFIRIVHGRAGFMLLQSVLNCIYCFRIFLQMSRDPPPLPVKVFSFQKMLIYGSQVVRSLSALKMSEGFKICQSCGAKFSLRGFYPPRKHLHHNIRERTGNHFKK